MGSLLVRNVDDQIVKALKVRAGKHGISAEAEHRRILKKSLLTPERKGFAEIIGNMPDVGKDEDFTRKDGEAPGDVFD